MVFAILITICFIIVLCLYATTKESLSQERAENKRLQEQVDSLKKMKDNNWDEKQALLLQSKRDLDAAYTLVANNLTTDKTDIPRIKELLEDYINAQNVKELFRYNDAYLAEIVLYAEKGFLDVYQTPSGLGFRLSSNGEKIFLSDDEVKMMCEQDYSFFLPIEKFKE